MAIIIWNNDKKKPNEIKIITKQHLWNPTTRWNYQYTKCTKRCLTLSSDKRLRNSLQLCFASRQKFLFLLFIQYLFRKKKRKSNKSVGLKWHILMLSTRSTPLGYISIFVLRAALNQRFIVKTSRVRIFFICLRHILCFFFGVLPICE